MSELGGDINEGTIKTSICMSAVHPEPVAMRPLLDGDECIIFFVKLAD
jgi:hypothetical protein